MISWTLTVHVHSYSAANELGMMMATATAPVKQPPWLCLAMGPWSDPASASHLHLGSQPSLGLTLALAHSQLPHGHVTAPWAGLVTWALGGHPRPAPLAWPWRWALPCWQPQLEGPFLAGAAP